MSVRQKQSAVVVCPGRGTYNAAELGYLQKYHSEKTGFLQNIDDYRRQCGQSAISELDAASRYQLSKHSTGDNASSLIYACSLADFQSINREKFDVVAVTGNSMGWYLALACAEALDENAAIELVNTMGTLMHNCAEGGQVIYPLVDEDWQPSTVLEKAVESAMEQVAHQPEASVYTSIKLGGMVVLAANSVGVKELLKRLPPVQDRYPFALPNHAAFHSPLMNDIAKQATELLPKSLFKEPKIPLIDGRGRVWQPYATCVTDLYEYTLGHQINKTYDFSKAIEVAIKEFAPDKLIITGPGSTLAPPVAQALFQNHWLDMRNKSTFKNRQKTDPFILGMGLEEQRTLVV